MSPTKSIPKNRKVFFITLFPRFGAVFAPNSNTKSLLFIGSLAAQEIEGDFALLDGVFRNLKHLISNVLRKISKIYNFSSKFR